MVPKKILNFLEKAKVKYQILQHKTVFTAFDKSQTLKLSPAKIGKTLILYSKPLKEVIFLLLPANRKVNLRKFKGFELASERLIKKKIKGVKVGAVPPFGNLWGAKTFGEKSLKKEKEIILNGGDWNCSIKISVKDLEKLIPNLVWGNFSKGK